MIQSIQQGLLADGIAVPLTKLCAWFGVPRRTIYYKPTKFALNKAFTPVLRAHSVGAV